MHVDLQSPPDQTEWQSDVCVMGAGVAGLLLADRLGRAGMTVHLRGETFPFTVPSSVVFH